MTFSRSTVRHDRNYDFVFISNFPKCQQHVRGTHFTKITPCMEKNNSYYVLAKARKYPRSLNILALEILDLFYQLNLPEVNVNL